MRGVAFSIVSASLILSACTSRPRTFEPKLAATPASEQAYQERLLYCRQQIAAAMDKHGRLASAAGGAAVGAAGGVAAGAATAGAVTPMAGAAVAGMAIMMAPIAALGGAWGIAKMKRNKKEKAVKLAMGNCLAEGGYQVADWDALSRREAKALMATLETQQKDAATEKAE